MLKEHLLTAGPVIYPLILCSVMTMTLVLERLLVLFSYNARASRADIKAFENNTVSWGAARGLKAGLKYLSRVRVNPKSLRDEMLNIWLNDERHYLMARTRWLMLIGSLAPLMGLLGTVLGIITMFQDVAHQTGPVTPAMLAGGMWEAMATTAVGLIIAIPALAAAQAFSIWGDYRLQRMAACLNRCSLFLEGDVVIDASTNPSAREKNCIKATAEAAAA